MAKNFKKARQINKLKVIEAADKLGISQPTLSAWEGERKSPSIEGLEKWQIYMVLPLTICLVAANK